MSKEGILNFFGHETVQQVLVTVTWLVVIIMGIAFLRRMMRKRIEDVHVRYKAQKGIQLVGYMLIVLVVLLSFTLDDFKDYTLIIGLFTAGLTFTLQELILSVAGSFYIFFVRVYKPGDRIEINNIKGDVIDIDSIYTTIMEIGEWVSTDNYSGRIVKISNAFVFKGPIKNYSMDFPFVWDELNILITHESDIKEAQRLTLQTANNVLSDYVASSKAQWSAMVKRYYIEDAALDPSIAIRITDNWIELNVRYITDYMRRRATKHLLFTAIGKAIMDSNAKIDLASTTLQLLKIPALDIHLKNKTK
jgi:small-conductance mechanosensitive channel